MTLSKDYDILHLIMVSRFEEKNPNLKDITGLAPKHVPVSREETDAVQRARDLQAQHDRESARTKEDVELKKAEIRRDLLAGLNPKLK